MSASRRLRIFAGPNGSGKSTLKNILSSDLLGVYLNPDEIEKEITATNGLDVRFAGIHISLEQLQSYLKGSSLFQKAQTSIASISLENSVITISESSKSPYFAAAMTDFLRDRLLANGISFTFETVMSHESKVDLLIQARGLGYRTYLYFVATDDPAINLARVRSRVKLGGHAVPEDRIISRYYRSLGLLMQAVHETNRAYIFDNSEDGREQLWLAEITNGNELEIKTDELRSWFQNYVLDKIHGADAL